MPQWVVILLITTVIVSTVVMILLAAEYHPHSPFQIVKEFFCNHSMRFGEVKLPDGEVVYCSKCSMHLWLRDGSRLHPSTRLIFQACSRKHYENLNVDREE